MNGYGCGLTPPWIIDHKSVIQKTRLSTGRKNLNGQFTSKKNKTKQTAARLSMKNVGHDAD